MKYEDTTIERLNFLLEENARLRDENKRLREALESLLDTTKAGVSTYEIGVMQEIVRTALQEPER